MKKFLFVCLGNICRSPAAEGAFRYLADKSGRLGEFVIDSAGTGDWHIGCPPDERSQAACLDAGFNISSHRARQVDLGDFYAFDLILACDQQNYNDLLRMAPPDATARVELLMSYAKDQGVMAISDPYYGGSRGFTRAIELCLAAAQGLLKAY